jgi:transcriptional regulator with XRE-family HTH domain/Zn-dependent peptidase ImmA (M78 family)
MMEMDLTNIREKLKSARQAAGLTTREAAEMAKAYAPISHATIANYESGKTQPTLEILTALAATYMRSIEWFLEQTATLSNVRYRHYRSKVTTSAKAAYEASVLRWVEAYTRLERRLGKPLRREVTCPQRGQNFEPEAYAMLVRQHLGIDACAPVQSVVSQMERCGIRVLEVPGHDGIDGLAAHFGDDPIVALNPACSNDRMRLNESHEFFHELLGHCGEAGSGGTDDETDAFACARTFLLPPEKLKEAFDGKSFVKLVKFKEMFGISLGAMIYAAEQANHIHSSEAKWLWIELSRRGWKVNEPGYVRPDRATRFEQLLDGAINSKTLDWKEASLVTGIPAEQLELRVKSAMGIQEVESIKHKGGEPTFKGMRLAK